jgi:short-subunit dehydrogenase
MLDDNAFQDKVVLITGAANGIGAACAREFQRRGALLSLVDRSEPCKDARLAPSVWTQGDITDRVVQEMFVQRTMDAYGRIDVLINNAGVGIYAGATDTPMDLARRMFDVNVFAAVGLTSLVAPYMRSQASGSVVNISSISAFVPTPWNTMYCASKSALHSFSRGLRRELASDGIHVLTVVPGIVRTGFRDNVLVGEPPTGVLKIRSSVSPDALAAATTEALRKRRSLLFFPFRAIPFCAVDLLLTPIMDLAIRVWHTPPTIRDARIPPRVLDDCEEVRSRSTKVG